MILVLVLMGAFAGQRGLPFVRGSKKFMKGFILGSLLTRPFGGSVIPIPIPFPIM